MITFDNYKLRLADQTTTHAKWVNLWRLGVVVFTRPEDQICKDIITPSLNYLHDLTGEKVHFYFVGYSNKNEGKYKKSVVSDLFNDGDNWYFSPHHFVKVQEKFEKLTNNSWNYTGSSDLLVVPYRIRKNVFYIDPSKALDIKLSKIAKQSENYLPEEIVQIIVRELKAGKDIDGVSNSRIMHGIKEGLKKSFLSILPNGLSGCYSVLEPFATRNLKK